MQAILLSIKPKWVAKILKGEKTIEVRRKFPKDYKGWVYIYCTKEETLSWVGLRGWLVGEKWKKQYPLASYNTGYQGKVVAKFTLNKVEELYNIYNRDTCDRKFQTKSLYYEELQKQSCVEDIEFEEYLLDRDGYAIHISNLEIFDKPKELGEFKSWKKTECRVCRRRTGLVYCTIAYDNFCTGCKKPLIKAPQSWCYVEI